MHRFLLTILMLIPAVFSFGQDACRKSTEGTDFWFGFMENRDGSEERFVEITVTARESTTFEVFIGPNQNRFGGIYTVDANNSAQVKIPWEEAETLGSEEIKETGVHLVSQKPVNVYALNWDIYSADIAVIYPVTSLGKEYFAMCYYPDIDRSNPFTGSGRNSEFLVVATENNTTVEITPSKVTHLLSPADSTFTVVLDQGEVFQVQSENIVDSDEEGQGDLTGSHVKANKPVAFYSGSLATRVPTGQCCWDHLYEQIPPIQAWGLEYFTVPLESREQDRYRVMASEDNTEIQITGRNSITLNRGEFEELVFSKNDPKRILGNKPILVAQFSQSNYTDSLETGGDGDPFMIILSSTAQTKNDVTFVTYESPELEDSTYFGIKKYFVNIISKSKDTSGIQLNGTFIGDQFNLFPGNNEFSFAQIEISQGVHRLVANSENEGFLAYVYGFGGFESFGYGVGFNLNLVLDLGESIFFEEDTLLLCRGDTLSLDAGRYFDTYNWSTGVESQTIEVTDSGFYHVETTTNEGCILRDSVFVYKSSPETNLDENDLEECEPFSIDLQGDDGYVKYIWQNEAGDTLSTQQNIIADQNGIYKITVIDEFNCTASDQMKLTIHPVPEIEISSNALICGGQETSLSVSVTDAPDSIWNYSNSFKWSTNDAENITFSNDTHTSVDIKVDDWGEYEIYYQLVTIDACETTDTFNISFYPKPSSDFKLNDPGKCQEYITQVEYIGDADQNANYLWDFGSSKVIDSLDWNLLDISLGTFNTNPLVQLVVEQNGCYSDTTRRLIGANPDFSVDVGETRGCDSMEVNFSSELNVADLVSFEWNFGDNSPVSDQQNPSHFYSEVGFYEIELTVTNLSSGCQAGFQVDSLVKIFPTPKADITADPDRCYPDTANLLYTFSIDSTIAFWEFDGMHEVGDGNDSVTVVIDDPTGTARLVVDEFGCMSDTASVQLKREPHFDFETAGTEGCAPYFAEIEAQPFDEQLNFSWLTDSVPYPGETISYLFQDSGRYTVGLIANSSETGCKDTLIKNNWIQVHPKPVADFSVNYAVALINNSTISFNNLSENADYFYWDFGDGNISNQINPQHTYEDIGEFTTTLMVESNLGCSDTTDYLITVIPGSVFAPNAFRPDSPIEENRTFMPLGQDTYQFSFNLKIFNRWGELIFETESENRPWDGTTKNGNPAPMGNYVWIADYTDVQGIKRQQKGQVLLIR